MMAARRLARNSPLEKIYELGKLVLTVSPAY